MSESSNNEIIAANKAEYEAYQKYLNQKEEWPGFKKPKLAPGSKIVLNEPFLIMELNRLVPYVDDDGYVKFHPLNMPYIKIGKVEIVGVVTCVKIIARFVDIYVQDGTGAIKCSYKQDYYDQDLKRRKLIDFRYKMQAEELEESTFSHYKDCPKKFPKNRPGFIYPQGTSLKSMAILENKWWSETDNGLLGKEIEPCDYVSVLGYLRLDLEHRLREQEKLTPEEILLGKLSFFATRVKCIPEKEYNHKIKFWIKTHVKNRYKTKMEPWQRKTSTLGIPGPSTA